LWPAFAHGFSAAAFVFHSVQKRRLACQGVASSFHFAVSRVRNDDYEVNVFCPALLLATPWQSSFSTEFRTKNGRGEIYPPVLWRGICQPQADLNAPEAHKPPWRELLFTRLWRVPAFGGLRLGFKFVEPFDIVHHFPFQYQGFPRGSALLPSSRFSIKS